MEIFNFFFWIKIIENVRRVTTHISRSSNVLSFCLLFYNYFICFAPVIHFTALLIASFDGRQCSFYRPSLPNEFLCSLSLLFLSLIPPHFEQLHVLADYLYISEMYNEFYIQWPLGAVFIHTQGDWKRPFFGLKVPIFFKSTDHSIG